MQTIKPVLPRTKLAAALSGMALLAAGFTVGCGTAASGHPAAASPSRPSSPAPAGSTLASVSAAGSGSTAGSGCAGAPAAGVNTALTQVPVPALDAVQFVSSWQGWAAGAGHVLATTDGGRTWTRQYTGTAALDQVDFVDARDGWATGTNSLLRTTDGGATWSAVGDPCGAIRSVHFVTPDAGYAVAGGSQVRIDGGLPAPVAGGELLATTDGGQSWAAVPAAPAQAQTVCFTSPSSGFLGTPGKIWRTSDAGRTWSLAFTEPAASGARPGAADTTLLQCAGAGAVWAMFLGSGAALGHAPYLVYAAQDARTMHPLMEEAYIESAIRPQVHAPDGPGSYPGPFSAISPDAAAFVGFDPAAGYGAAPLMTVTGGAPHARGNVGGISQAYGASFVSTTQGWVVGKNLQSGTYAIEATTNGGHTWTPQYQTR
jgi:photosystem II stability/assembly factor-like uncharacterized protein